MSSDKHERCGVVYASGEVKELVNLHPDPRDNFMILEEELIQPEVIGTFHTHPRSGPNLTIPDYFAFSSYPKLKHYIISGQGIWCFHMRDGILCRYENPNLPRFPADLSS